MAEVQIPAFDFSAFYYQQILEALLSFKRTNVPELTDESPQEPLIQMLRGFAAVGHLNNALLDQAANESTLVTARLPASVRNMLSLIGYKMSPAVPSQTELLYELAQVLSVETEIVPAFAQASTQGTVADPARYFEADEAVVVEPTDELTAAFAIESGVAADITANVNGGGPIAPWATPIGGAGGLGTGNEGDSFIFCHAQVMWNLLAVELSVVAAGIVGVWEWYDGRTEKTKPTTVTQPAANLVFGLNGYLGTASRAGTKIRVQLIESGAYEDAFVEFAAGVNRVTLVGVLGQTTPSLSTDDYYVGSTWNEFSNLIDGPANLSTDGDVEFSIPQNLTQNWEAGTLQGVEGFWMRFRIISVATPTAPVIDALHIDTGSQFVKVNATQGRSHSDDPIGSSNGEANQRFEGSKDAFVDGSDAVLVGGVQWTRVENFLASRPTDRHYRVELGDDDRPVFIFGDGVTGAIPTAGVGNVRADYRYGANLNGNVGAGTITSDKAGLIYVNTITNPRPAGGWAQAEGSDAASLENAKIEGPASLRTRDIALGPDDAITLAKRAHKIDTSVIKVSRAKAIEEGFGPKTIELVIVLPGGTFATQDQLDALSVFFNGNQFVSPQLPKRLVANQELTAVNYTPRVFDVTATIRGNVTEAQVKAVLNALLHPEAKKSDGISYEWEFGETVTTSRLSHEIFKVDESITDVDITVPAADVPLVTRELPVAGAFTLTILPPS